MRGETRLEANDRNGEGPGAMTSPNFEGLVPRKPALRIREIVDIVGMGETFLEDYFKSTEKYHAYNNGRGKRDSMRIPRVFVIELLVKSAKFHAEAKRDAVLSCLPELGADELVTIANTALAIADRVNSQREDPLSSLRRPNQNR